ncbi:GNAT family N-acetyltransferase [Demequina sp.]|uniref:GNAT family N-acetyltransferase n=1 Tax=Demequina sp. TaxID=2050685 RepID=UPI003A8908E6
MSTPEGYTVVNVPAERSADYVHVGGFAFAFTPPAQEASALAAAMPWHRARGIEIADASRGEVGSLAAVHASFPYRMRVPGGREVATAGLTWVAVHPGHRRRGLLRTMMADHFSRSLERGEAVSLLYAAETAIYQRFGYGLAARDLGVEFGRGTEFRDVEGADDLTVTIDSASAQRDGAVIRQVQAQMLRPGAIVDFPDETIADIFMDLEGDRNGQEERRIAIVRDGDTPVAWALFQRKGDWTPFGPDGTVNVHGWAALDAKATVRLWRVLVDLDLMAKTWANRIALDDPLVYLIKDLRGGKFGVRDNVWCRVLDPKAALEARGYAADCDVTVALDDPTLPDNAGVWRIAVTGGDAQVSKIDGADAESADLAMNVQELGAAYLGGTSIGDLYRAGLVKQRRDGAADQLARAMSSDLQPVTNFGF